MAKRISIVGAGWLGLPLGQRLAEAGHHVGATTTTPEKSPAITMAGITPYYLRLTPQELQGQALDEFFSAEVFIVCIPPRLRRGKAPEEHVHEMALLAHRLCQRQPQHLIYTSSTGAYPNLNREVTEADAPPEPEPDSGSILPVVEHNFLQCGIPTTILRLGGLFGPGRQPALNLAGRTDLPRGRAPVNLIHQTDCLGVIETLLDGRWAGELFNAVADEHPTRAAYYRSAAEALGVEPPQFRDEVGEWKIVSNAKLKRETGYVFQCPLDPAKPV